MGLRWISLLLFFSGCKVSLRLIPFSAAAAFHSISICAAFSYILYMAALHCCVLYRAAYCLGVVLALTVLFFVRRIVRPEAYCPPEMCLYEAYCPPEAYCSPELSFCLRHIVCLKCSASFALFLVLCTTLLLTTPFDIPLCNYMAKLHVLHAFDRGMVYYQQFLVT